MLITRARTSRFKDFLKKQGYKLESGKIVDLDGTTSLAANTPKTPKKPRKSGNEKANGSTGKKRTAEEMEDEHVGPKEEPDAISVKDEADAADEEV